MPFVSLFALSPVQPISEQHFWLTRGIFRRRSRSRSPKKARAGSRDQLQSFSAYSADGSRSVDEYDSYVRSFQQRNARAFFEHHRDEAWFRERYHPAELEQGAVAQGEQVRLRASEWQERAERGELTGTSYSFVPAELAAQMAREMEGGSGAAAAAAGSTGTDQEDGNEEAVVQEMASGAVGATLVLTGVSARVSEKDIAERVASTPGEMQVRELWLGTPTPGRHFTRSGWLTLGSADMAQAVQIHLQGTLIEGSALSLGFARSGPCTPQTLPPLAASLARQTRDNEQAVALAAALDQSVGLEPTGGLEGDLAIRYLRQVHCFCYYAGQQFGCLAELRSQCPDYYRAASASASDAAQEDNAAESTAEDASAIVGRGEAWAEALDYRLAQRMARLQPAAVAQRLGQVEADRAATLLQTRTCQPDGEGRYRCGECSKLFLTMEYVVKHFGNKHADSIDKVRREALDEQSFRNYAADPDHLVSSEAPSNQYGDDDDDRPLLFNALGSSLANQNSYYHRPRRPEVPVPDDAAPDPREIRSVYQEMVAVDAVEMSDDEMGGEEIDYRLM